MMHRSVHFVFHKIFFLFRLRKGYGREIGSTKITIFWKVGVLNFFVEMLRCALKEYNFIFVAQGKIKNTFDFF